MHLPMPMRLLLCSVVVLLTLPKDVAGQNVGYGWLRVETNLHESLVLADSAYVGRAGGALLRVPSGARTILLVPTEVGAWGLKQPQEEVMIVPGDTVVIEMNFPIQYRIDSVPFGAVVSVAEPEVQVLGTTPLVYATDQALQGVLSLHLSGYAVAEIEPGSNVVNRHSVVLLSLDPDLNVDKAVEWAPRSSRNTWINWAATGLLVTGGALAVNFKFKANEEYERYLETGDPESRSQVDRYDTYSYVALGAMQIGIGILAFRLAF
jgi:hypothetical protein